MAFRRNIYQRPPVAPPKPLARPVRVAEITGEVLATLKDAPARSESYRRWVASLPCCVCGLQGFSQAAHPNNGRGLGQKSSDLDCFPLCCTRSGTPGHHWEHDNLFQMTLDERRDREALYTAHTRTLAIQAGRPELQT